MGHDDCEIHATRAGARARPPLCGGLRREHRRGRPARRGRPSASGRSVRQFGARRTDRERHDWTRSSRSAVRGSRSARGAVVETSRGRSGRQSGKRSRRARRIARASPRSLPAATADLCADSLPGPEGPVSRTCVWPRENGSACNRARGPRAINRAAVCDADRDATVFVRTSAGAEVDGLESPGGANVAPVHGSLVRHGLHRER